MTDPSTLVTLAVAGLAALAMLTAAALSGWRGWLELQRLSVTADHAPREREMSPSTAARIEIADLKERIRKLEAIAAGIDL